MEQPILFGCYAGWLRLVQVDCIDRSMRSGAVEQFLPSLELLPSGRTKTRPMERRSVLPAGKKRSGIHRSLTCQIPDLHLALPDGLHFQMVPRSLLSKPLRRRIYLEFFGNCVDRIFVGIPPIPQKNAEWMGHESS